MKKQILLDNLEQLETKEYTKFTPMLVPESFAELKELCKQYNNVIIGEDYIQFKWHLTLFEKGYIQIDTRVVAFRRTPAQMWQIIKGLIGE